MTKTDPSSTGLAFPSQTELTNSDDILSIFVIPPWYDDKYVELQLPDFECYLHPPYIGLFLKFSEN